MKTIYLKNDMMNLDEAEEIIRLVKERTDEIEVRRKDVFIYFEYIEEGDYYYCEIYGKEVSANVYFNIDKMRIGTYYRGGSYLRIDETRVELMAVE